MVISGGQAVFAVVAKDAATKTLNGVGKAFGSLKRTGINALKGLATASVVAATALAGFVGSAIKAAADEELQIIRLNAALRARGFELDKLAPKIEEQILAFRRFGIADETVRRGIEVGSRFFKNQGRLLKVNAVAANIAAVTGADLADVMLAIGKAAKTGSTKGLTKYLGEIKKGATFMDILTLANEKYAGTADEVAKSTSAQFFAAQEALNDEFEKFGTQFLPRVTEGLKIFQRDILPGIVRVLDDLGPKITDLIDKFIVPLVDSFDELAKTMGFEDGFGFLIGAIEVALIPLKVALSVIKGLLDGINEAFKLFNNLSSSKTGALLAGNARTQYLSGGNLGVASPMGATSSYLQTNIDFSIGTQRQDKLVSDSLIRQGTGRRGGY
jgi:hypothetical protein